MKNLISCLMLISVASAFTACSDIPDDVNFTGTLTVSDGLFPIPAGRANLFAHFGDVTSVNNVDVLQSPSLTLTGAAGMARIFELGQLRSDKFGDAAPQTYDFTGGDADWSIHVNATTALISTDRDLVQESCIKTTGCPNSASSCRGYQYNNYDRKVHRQSIEVTWTPLSHPAGSTSAVFTGSREYSSRAKVPGLSTPCL